MNPVPSGLAVDGGHLYWTTGGEDDGTTTRANPDGSRARAIVGGQRSPTGVAVAS